MSSALLFLYTETPLHCGGAASAGAIDLPIQRETTTRLPVVWGQSLKGALRAHAQGIDGQNWTAVFGSPPPSAGAPDGGLVAGALRVNDARLVLLPAPTLRETFAWSTAGVPLTRLGRIVRLAGGPALPAPTPLMGGDALASGAGWEGAIALGDLAVTTKGSETIDEWAPWLAANALPASPEFAYFRERMLRNVIQTSDGVFTELAAHCVEVMARIQLNSDTKTVEHGPWFEEALPPETLLSSLLTWDGADHEVDALLGALDNQTINLGGSESVGRGLVWCRVFRGDRDPAGAA